MRQTLRMALGALALTMLAAACATTGVTPTTTPPSELPRTLAVLPFVPLPEKEEQTRVLGRMIYGVLSAMPYDVLKPQVVEERLVREGLTDPKAVTAKDPAELARLLRVDGLVYGELTHWDRMFLGIYAQVTAGGAIRLVDGRTGETLFERREVARNRAGGLPTNALSVAVQVVQSALQLREIELVRACDDLVRSLLKDVPTPPVGQARRPPAFANVLSDGAGRLLKAGDTVIVIAEGQPGVIGSFDVVPLAKNLALDETREGVYIGRYTVKPGDSATDAYVVARLADTAGRVSEREDVLGRFAVDTMPPAIPRDVKVRLRDGVVHVSWAANQESDLAGYRVYRSDSALTGFSPVATIEGTFYDEPLDRAGFYRVAAIDRAGNESEPTASMRLPVLSSVLTGRLDGDAYLTPAGSPYVVEGSLVLDSGATLTILPGVVVKFASGAEGIVVRDGAVIARGTATAPVILISGSDRPTAGDYRAALNVRAKPGQTSMLEHVRIEHAAVGLKVEAGGVEATRMDVVGNQHAGIEVAETGVLKLSDSRIAGHASGGGVTVRGFGRALLRGNNITDNGWAVVNYSGNQVDARGNWWGVPAPADSLFLGDVDRRDALTSDGGSPRR